MKKTAQVIEENIVTDDSKKWVSFITVLILFLYLSIDFLPKFSVLDIAGIQWIGITIINILVGVFIFYNKKNESDLSILKLNNITILYAVFILLSGISILFATNKIEGIATFVKLITIFISFILLTILSKQSKAMILNFSVIVSIILFFQCYFVIMSYYSKVNNVSSDTISQILAANTGNINIFASAILLKLPFVFYCLFNFSNLKKYFFLVVIFLSTIILFLTASRTNILSLSLYFLLLLGFNYSNKTLKSNFKIISLLLLTVLLGYAVANFKTSKSSNTIINYDTKVTESVPNPINANDFSGNRLQLWENTWQLIKEKPLTGFGLGSYKIEVIPYESKQRNYFAVSGHTHNDFLQIAAESGILVALIYLSIFVLCFFLALKQLLNKENSKEQLWISFIVLLSIIAYGIDSLLNFPIDRPITQIHFVIILFWLSSITNNNKKFHIKNTTSLLICLIASSVILLVPNFINYKSLKGQNAVFADEKTQKLTFNQVNNLLPNYPNITAYGSPIKAVKASYLINENNFDEARKLLNESMLDNKNLKYSENLIANIYSKQKNYDSLVKYRKECFDMFPLVKNFYTNYLVSLRNKKDTLGVKKALEYAKKYNSPKEFENINIDLLNYLNGKAFYKDEINPNVINNSKSTIQNSQNDKPKTDQNATVNYIAIAEKYGLAKNFDLALLNYEKALISQPNNPIVLQNIGICSIMLKNYSKGIESLKKVLNNPKLNDGKTEYYIGIAYFNSGVDKNKFCEFMKIAKSKNYQAAIEIADKYCK